MDEAKVLLGILMTMASIVVVQIFTLNKIADDLRKEIIEAVIWDAKSFPKSVAHIELQEAWRCIVTGYYKDIDRILRTEWILLAMHLLLLLVIGVSVISIGSLNNNGGLSINGGDIKISFGWFIIIILGLIVILWNIFVILKVREMHRLKDRIDITLASAQKSTSSPKSEETP